MGEERRGEERRGEERRGEERRGEERRGEGGKPLHRFQVLGIFLFFMPTKGYGGIYKAPTKEEGRRGERDQIRSSE